MNAVPFESLPEQTQQRIENKAASLIVRASVKNALLSKSDIATLTGYSIAQVEKLAKDAAWPAAYKPVAGGHPRWRSAEVFAYLATKRDLKWLGKRR